MAISSGNFAELLWPGIKQIWGTAYSKYSPLYTQIFDIQQSDKAFEKHQGVTGLGLLGVKNQGEPIGYDDVMQGFQKEYVNVTYARGVIVTREMVEDEQYNYINQLPAILARSARDTEETVTFNILNRAFNASFTGADGSALCVTNHALVGGGTFSNTLATAADLTQTSLETAIQNLMDIVDDRGLKIQVRPKQLVVPTAIALTAMKLLQTTQVVGSADNDKNPIPMFLPSQPLVSPYLTDPDAWFIITDVPNGLTFFRRRAAAVERDNDFDTQNLKFAVSERFSTGFTDPRGVFASPGA